MVSMALIVRLPERVTGRSPRKSTGDRHTPQHGRRRSVNRTQTPAATASPEQVDLQQVEQALDDLDIVSP